MKHIVILIIGIMIFFTGCQKTYEPTKASDISNDIIQLHNILKGKQEIYFEKDEYTLNDSELDNVSKILDNISSNINELNYLKKISKDDELYTALKILVDLELMTILSSQNIKVENVSNTILSMVQLQTKELISLVNAGVDIRQYIDDYKELTCIGASCGHINEIMLVGQIFSPLLEMKLDEPDKKAMDMLNRRLMNSWGLYLFQSDGSNRLIYKSIASKYLPYLEKKQIYNDNIANMEDKLIKYIVSKSMNFVYLGKMYAFSYMTDSKYLKEFFKIRQFDWNITEKEIEGITEERKSLFPAVCNNIELLFEEGKKECLDYVNNTSFEKIISDMKDENINEEKTYIMIDDEVCMIKDSDKINFYSKNILCEAIKNKSK